MSRAHLAAPPLRHRRVRAFVCGVTALHERAAVYATLGSLSCLCLFPPARKLCRGTVLWLWRERVGILESVGEDREACGVFLPPSSQAASVALYGTIWVKAKLPDGTEGQYSAKKAVDLRQTVDDLKSSWAAEEMPGARPGFILLRLVHFEGVEPTEAEEAAAKVLLPRLTLAAAGVTDGCLLLASVAGTAVAPPGECVAEMRA